MKLRSFVPFVSRFSCVSLLASTIAVPIAHAEDAQRTVVAVDSRAATSGTVAVRFDSDTRGVDVFVAPAHGPRETLRFVCTTPCAARVPVGFVTVALGLGDDPAVEVKQAIQFDEGASYFVRLHSSSRERTGGLVLLGAGGGTGLTLLATGASFMAARNSDQGGVLLAIGGVITVASAVVGAILTSRPDVASVGPSVDPTAWIARTAVPANGANGANGAAPNQSACSEVGPYQRRAAETEGPARTQLERLAKRKADECAAAGGTPTP